MAQPQDAKASRRQTALAVADAYSRLDIDAIISLSSDDCMRYMVPTRLNRPTVNNKEYADHLRSSKPVVSNYKLEVLDILDDPSDGRVVVWLRGTATTFGGEFDNDFMWILSFNEAGTKITKAIGFVDTAASEYFLKTLKPAHEANQTSLQTQARDRILS